MRIAWRLPWQLRSIGESLDEVDKMAAEMGYNFDDEEEQEIAVIDTKWSGQAGLDVTVAGQRNWFDIPNRPVLAAGDMLALTIFAYIGRASHGSGSIDLGVLATAAPFAAGWIGIAPLLGAYTAEATSSQGAMVRSLLTSWGVAVPAGIALRAWAKGEVPPTPFVVVSMAATFVVLAVWRGVYVAFNPTSTEETKRGGILDGFRMITTLLQRW